MKMQMLPIMANWKWCGKLWIMVGMFCTTQMELYSQSLLNLIPNPSFEEGVECLDHPVQLMSQINSTMELVDHWFNSNGNCFYVRNYYASPNCNDGDRISIPSVGIIPNVLYPFQYPFDGEAFVLIRTYDTYLYYFFPEQYARSSIGVKLIEPLQVGKKYHLKLYTNLINTASHSSYVTILFSNKYLYKDFSDDYEQFKGVFIPPQIIIPNVDDTMNWVPFETWFYADSAYQYMYIGNFLPDSISNFTQLKPMEQWFYNGLYFVASSVYYVDGIVVEEAEELPLPNVISPNGDGVNDAWVVPEPVTPMHLVIYNRWGQLVYESNNYQNNWSGQTLQGGKVTDGTYFYVLTMPHAPPKKGFIQVFGE